MKKRYRGTPDADDDFVAPSAVACSVATRRRATTLPEVGTQSVASEVLSGKRKLNLRQVRALAKRFRVPMEAFAA